MLTKALLILFLLPIAQKKADPPPDIVFPPDPVAPTPPTPPPGTPIQLAPKQFYVVGANKPIVVVASPDGILKVTKKTGTVTVAGDIYGSSDDVVDYSFQDSVYLIRGIAKGTAELITVNGQVVTRKTIQVLDGPPPPTPPVPPPTPPPTDPLVIALQKAYDVESDPQKAVKLPVLAQIYSLVVQMSKKSGKVTTLLQLETKDHEAIDGAIGAGVMGAVRKVASEYVASKLPKVDQNMTDALWATAASAYADVAAALGKVSLKGGK